MELFSIRIQRTFQLVSTAYDESEAEAIGVTMLENGELDCAGQICAAATAVLV